MSPVTSSPATANRTSASPRPSETPGAPAIHRQDSIGNGEPGGGSLVYRHGGGDPSKGSPPAERGSTRHRPGADNLRGVIQRAEGGGSEAAREGLRKAAPPLPRPFPQAARFSQSPESRFASGALSPAHCQYAQRFPSQVHDQDQQKPRGDLCRELERASETGLVEPGTLPWVNTHFHSQER